VRWRGEGGRTKSGGAGAVVGMGGDGEKGSDFGVFVCAKIRSRDTKVGILRGHGSRRGHGRSPRDVDERRDILVARPEPCVGGAAIVNEGFDILMSRDSVVEGVGQRPWLSGVLVD
jgi:hypothetical protein